MRASFHILALACTSVLFNSVAAVPSRMTRRNDQAFANDLSALPNSVNNTVPDFLNVATEIGTITGLVTLLQKGNIASGSAAYSDIQALIGKASGSLQTSVQNINNLPGALNGEAATVGQDFGSIGLQVCDDSSDFPCTVGCDHSSANPCPGDG